MSMCREHIKCGSIKLENIMKVLSTGKNTLYFALC